VEIVDIDIDALIAEQRAEIERVKSEQVDVVAAGKIVTVVVQKLRPDEWQALVAKNAPRTAVSADANVGYNQDALPRVYPVDRIKVAGKTVTPEQWSSFFEVIEPAHKANVHTVMWGLNVFTAIKELQELGKAAAGQQSSSPANRESRRAASKAGSRQV
jgi:hypothetical protein